MAKLVDIYHTDKDPVITSLLRRQLPLAIYENLTMVMDLNSMGLVCDNPQVKGREFDDFMRKYKVLTPDDIKSALNLDYTDIVNVLDQSIPCVGCRRSVERLFCQLVKSGDPTLDPLVVKPTGQLTIRDDKITHPQSLATLLNGHSRGIEWVVESQPRWKKGRRCALHSLEGGVGVGVVASTGVSSIGRWAGGRGAWRAAWDAMLPPARDHLTLVHFHTLHDTLHNYLRKHRFCADCKTKVLRAYQLLVEEKEPQKEKGYVSALYGGIKRCLLDKHLHLQPKTDYIAHLIARAEPELLGNHRERHAKTLEIAQEEVLICLGICIYERLHRISLRLREEEGTCQALAAVAVEALYRKFETAVELKIGVSKLELLYEEITQAEVTRQQRKEQKKLRRRKKKERQALVNNKEAESEEPEEKCRCEECQMEERDMPSELIEQNYACCEADEDSCQSCPDTKVKTTAKKQKAKKRGKGQKMGSWNSNEQSQDHGYSSGNNGGCCGMVSGSSSLMSSPEGSEVACSEGFCNHEGSECLETNKTTDCKPCLGFTMSLQDMLLDTSSSDEEDDTCYIPIEEVMAYKSRRTVTDKARQELRESLRHKFAQLCHNPQKDTSVNKKTS